MPGLRPSLLLGSLLVGACGLGPDIRGKDRDALLGDARVFVNLARRPADPERALTKLEGRLRRDLEDSQAGRFRDNPKRSLGLTAHYYETDPDDGDWEASVQLGLSCAKTFFASRAYRRVLAVGSDAIVSVEELESFLVDGVKVWVKLDLAMRGKDDGSVVIVDWKTGQHHAAEDIALQLGVYGLYGARAWDLRPDQIVALDVNLRDESMTTHPIDAATLVEVEAYIQASIDAMRAALDDVPTNTASEERFPLTSDLWKCRRCRFRGACGREGV